jgi:(1->4)-alpha-D-glucan 1-alpha-D-glucosylmutase
MARELLDNLPDGRAKMYVASRALRLRRERSELFAGGEYVPLEVTGPAAEHVFAYARRNGSSAVVIVVPRLLSGLVESPDRLPVGPDVWGDIRLELPAGVSRWENVFTGETVEPGGIPVAQILAQFPVALFTS